MFKVTASDHFDTIFPKIALQELSGTRLMTLMWNIYFVCNDIKTKQITQEVIN